MAFVGSDVLDVTYNNPVVGNGTLFCKAGEGSKIDLGGLRTEEDTNGVSGNGKPIFKKVMKRSNFELPPVAWDKTDKDELAKLSQLAASGVGSTWTVSFVDGSIYQMQEGYPVGDIAGEGSEGTIELVLQGAANASKIS